MSAHTAEPWATYLGAIWGAGAAVAPDMMSADARRIVACVNACEDLATGDLEAIAAQGRPQRLSDLALLALVAAAGHLRSGGER